eukprot:symbB.v1.2.024894.t1/scaffold2388.1/size114014/11
MGHYLRWISVLLLQLLELALPISLYTVEGTAVGEEFWLFFTGLLSANPLVGQRIRKNATPPVAHPGLLSTWKLSTDVSVLPFGLDVMLRMRDGSISAFQGMLLSDETLRARCESSGSLDQEKLKIEVDSFSITSSGDRGIFGAASIQVSLGAGGFGSGPVSVTKAQLPEVLFAACSEGLKPGALEVRCKVSLEENSELPEPLRVTFRDEHPLMLGSANVAARLCSLQRRGSTMVSGARLPDGYSCGPCFGLH